MRKKKETYGPLNSLNSKQREKTHLTQTNASDSIPIHPPNILFPLFYSCFSSLSAFALFLSIHARSTFLHPKNNLFLNPLQKGPDVVGSVGQQTQQRGIKLHLFSKPPMFLKQTQLP